MIYEYAMRAKSPLFKRKKGVKEFRLIPRPCTAHVRQQSFRPRPYLESVDTVVLTKLTFHEVQVMVFQLSQDVKNSISISFLCYSIIFLS